MLLRCYHAASERPIADVMSLNSLLQALSIKRILREAER
jgi:hypothetical protein